MNNKKTKKNNYYNKSKCKDSYDVQKYSQVFIELPNLNKHLKNIEKYKLYSKKYNKIITPQNEYYIENEKIYSITQKPEKSFSKQIHFEDDEFMIYVNEYNQNKKSDISHIDSNNKIIRVEKTVFKLNHTSKVKCVIENSIVIPDTFDEFDLNFDDTDNDVFQEYYFIVENGESVKSHFIIEDIYAFLKELN